DTIFAPLYEVLKARGVTFKFFHRVEQLHLSPDGRRIQAIDVSRQVTLKDGKEYQPLIDVKGLPCWPSQPLADQIVEGDRLKETILVAGQDIPKYNLESFWTPWPNVEKLTLKVEQNFDIVLLGISLGALRWVCSELIAVPGPQGDAWRKMMTHVKTVQTQAFQVWMKPDTAGLGWPLWKMGLAVMDAYDVGPVETKADTWTDMSHLILRESWPDDHTPGNISYFCGARRGLSLDQLPPPTDHEFPLENFRQSKEDSLEFLRRYIQPLWQHATRPDGKYPSALDWDLLVDLGNRQGEARFDGQFWRLNADPTERYVLTLAGSTKYRLRTDGSGYDNLFLTGDWIYNGANAGFVESAVMSGLLASQAITARLIGKASPERIVGWPSA
ncbi:MAG TPA: amine oxidase, partial [Anaerolineae bacterium]|nr:amine oxidase [Anaerolineae bacterium]